MSTERKLVKFISFGYAIFAVIYLLMAILMGVLGGFAGAEGDTQTYTILGLSLNTETWAIIYAVIFVLYAILDFALARTGIAGANTPRKMGQFRTLSFVALALIAIDFVSTLLTNPDQLLAMNNLIDYVELALTIGGIIFSGKVIAATER